MPAAVDTIVYVQRVLADPEGLHQFQHRDSVIYSSIPSDCLENHELPDFVTALATSRGEALSQLISEAGTKHGTCFYGGWIDQAVFTIIHTSASPAVGLLALLPLLATDPIDQQGDTVIGFVPDDASHISLVHVSRETRFVHMSHYCDTTAIHTALTAAR